MKIIIIGCPGAGKSVLNIPSEICVANACKRAEENRNVL
jgi:broad-specificity NMP kinase